MQGFPGEPGEVDRHLGLLESPLDVRPQRDRTGGPLPGGLSWEFSMWSG